MLGRLRIYDCLFSSLLKDSRVNEINERLLPALEELTDLETALQDF